MNEPHGSVERRDCVTEASRLPVLDAALVVRHFNLARAGSLRLPEIEPAEVFAEPETPAVRDALAHASRLLAWHGALGAAAYGYPDAPPFEEAVARMKAECPGFGESSYRKVIGLGMYAMR